MHLGCSDPCPPEMIPSIKRLRFRRATYLKKCVHPEVDSNGLVEAILLMTLQLAVNLLVLLQEHESRDRVRAEADETRHPALEHPHQPLLGRDAGDEGQYAFFRRGAHDASLDHVHGTANRGSHKACHQGGAEVGVEVVPHLCSFQQLFLEQVVGCELRGGHQQCPGAVGPDTTEQACHAFFAGHAYQSIDCVFVISFLRRWQRRIILHANIEDVGGIADYAAEEARGGGHEDELEEGRAFGVGVGDIFQFLVDSEPRGAVGDLA